MKNKKIISLICALAMILSLFTGFAVKAAGEKGIELEATMSDDAKTLTVVAKAVNCDATGVKSAMISFEVPEDATVAADAANKASYESKVGGQDYTWKQFNINAQHILKLTFYDDSGDPIKFDDDVLATITIPLTKALDDDYTVTLDTTATIEDAAGEVTRAQGSMPTSSSTANNKLVKSTKETRPDPSTVTETGTVTPVEPEAGKKGIALEASFDKTNTILTVVAKAVNCDATGVKSAMISFRVPEDATVAADAANKASYESKVGGQDYTWKQFNINAQHILKLTFYDDSGDPIKFDDDVLATITIPLTTAITEPYPIELDTTATIEDAAGEVTLAQGQMTATKAYAIPQEADKGTPTTVDVKDYMGVDEADNNKSAVDVAKDYETAQAAGEHAGAKLYITVDVKKDNADGTAKVDADYGSDYVAEYNGKELTKKEFVSLIGGYTDDKMSDIIAGLKIKVYDSAKGAQIKTSLNATDAAKQLVNNQETTDVNTTPDTRVGTDSNAVFKEATGKGKPITTASGKQTNTLTITLGADKEKKAYDFGTLKFALTEESLESLTLAGVVVEYTPVDKTELTGDETTVKVKVTDTTVQNLTAAEDNKYTVTFTPGAAGKVSYTATYTGKDQNGAEKVTTATALYTISAATTTDGGNGGGGSGSSSSGGGGAIATGYQGGSTAGLPGAASFTDLGDADWATEAVTMLAYQNIVSGYEDNTFRPNGNITRAEFAQILINAIGHNGDSADTYFDDVPTDAWFYHNVAVASQLGIVSGYGDGNFGPYDLITREQMALMTQKAAKVMNVNLSGADAGTFADDADIADWSKDAVYELANAGIINGMGDGTFAPKANATRAQASVIIYNTFVK